MMILQPKRTVNLFDKFTLVIPPRLNWHMDGSPGSRVLFITDRPETFTVSFEEGMQLMDMRPESSGGAPTVSAQCCENGKYIHQRRSVQDSANFAFFHIELDADNGGTLYLPGQLMADADYQWSDGIEPVLMELMNGLTEFRVKGGGGD